LDKGVLSVADGGLRWPTEIRHTK